MNLHSYQKYNASKKDRYPLQSAKVVLNTLLFGDRIMLPEVLIGIEL